MNAYRGNAAVSEGLAVLSLIGSRGGCLLSEISAELGIPKKSAGGWIEMLCSTGYLRRCGQEHKECACEKSGIACISCRCGYRDAGDDPGVRIEVTDKGRDMIRRSCDEEKGSLSPL